MRNLYCLAGVLLLGSLAACGGESVAGAEGGAAGSAGNGGSAGGGNAGSGGTAGGGNAGSGGSGGDVQVRSVRIGPFDVEPGDEQTMCVVVDLGNTDAQVIRRVRTSLTNGSHHMIVSAPNAPPSPAVPCGAFSHPDGALFIAEKREAELVYPGGTGVPVSSHQSIALELHFVNYFSDAQEQIWGDVEFELEPASDSIRPVEFLFTGELNIFLPARTQGVVEGSYSLPAGAELVALTSHTHALGVRSTITRSLPSGQSELLHESTDWDSPPFDVWDPGLLIGAGEQLNLRCEYDNYTDQDVHFGTGFADEMCFLWAHYLEPQ